MKTHSLHGEYARRTLLGTIQWSAKSVQAFGIGGMSVGKVSDQRAATAALAARSKSMLESAQ